MMVALADLRNKVESAEARQIRQQRLEMLGRKLKRRRPLWSGMFVALNVVIYAQNSKAELHKKRLSLGGRRRRQHESIDGWGRIFQHDDSLSAEELDVTSENNLFFAPASLAPTFSPSHVSNPAVGYPPSPTAPPTHKKGSGSLLSKSSKSNSPAEPLKFAAIPIQFGFGWETNEEPEPTRLVQEAKVVLEDYVMLSFQDGFQNNDGVVIRNVDLSVKAVPKDGTKNRMLRTYARAVQTSVVTIVDVEASGVAGFQVNRSKVETQVFLDDIDSILDEVLQPDPLTSAFREYNASYDLSKGKVSTVRRTTDGVSSSGKTKPSILRIVLGFFLLALAVAGLLSYAYMFWRKRQKSLRRRKQMGMGVGNKPGSPYRARPHGAIVSPSKPTAMLASSSPVLLQSTGSASTASSYKGLGSESDEEGEEASDAFARELKVAATRDRQAWSAFEQRKRQINGDGYIQNREKLLYGDISNAALYHPNSFIGNGVEHEIIPVSHNVSSTPRTEVSIPPAGSVDLRVTGDTITLRRTNSFPYGDEENKEVFGDEPTASVYGDILRPVEPGNSVTWMTQGGIPSDSYSLRENEGPVEVDRAYQSRSNEHRGMRGGTNQTDEWYGENSQPKYSFLYPVENPTESDTTNTGSRSTSNPSDSRSKFRVSPTTTDQTSGAVRLSPDTSKSWSTTVRTDPSLEKSASAIESNIWPSTTQHSPLKKENQPFTSDIVKEVQLLSQFVRSYEEKKGRRRRQLGAHPFVESEIVSDTSTAGYDTINRAGKSESYSEIKKKSESNPQGFQDSSALNTSREGMELPVGVDYGQSKDRDLRVFASLETVDSSEIEDADTVEESTEEARRLGINPFRVQRPTWTSNPSARFTLPVQEPPRQRLNLLPDLQSTPTAQQRSLETAEKHLKSPVMGVSDVPQLPEYRRSRDEVKISPERFPNSLESLRFNEAILDGADEAALALSDGAENSANFMLPEKVVTSSPLRGSSGLAIEESAMRNPQTIMPRSKSKSQGFNNIVDMFEAKQKDAIFPAGEHWQYQH